MMMYWISLFKLIKSSKPAKSNFSFFPFEAIIMTSIIYARFSQLQSITVVTFLQQPSEEDHSQSKAILKEKD